MSLPASGHPTSLPAPSTRLPVFLALSLGVHALALGIGMSRYTPASDHVWGETELHVRMTSGNPRAGGNDDAERRQTPSSFSVPAETAPDDNAGRSWPSPANPGVAQDSAAVENYVIGTLQNELSRYLVYPRLARERGWQGTVLVKVALAPDGVLHGLRLVRSSGHALLDEASLAGLRKVRSLPITNDQRWMEPLEIILPIRFQLVDNG